MRKAQRLLGVTVDGDFGLITERAGRAVQSRAGLKVDGVNWLPHLARPTRSLNHRFVTNWKTARQWHAAQALAFLVAVPVTWEQMPDEITKQIRTDWEPHIVACVALGGLLGRLRRKIALNI